jgi:hypothetical protein
LKDLFDDYDKRERPVENEYEGLEVTVGYAVTQIIDLVKIQAYVFLKLYSYCFRMKKLKY